MKLSKPRPPTAFERRIYALLELVPRGRVTTYGALAQAVGGVSARAVGQALRRNPFAPRVPCHRVIAADGTPGGFNGRRGGPELRRKLELLRAEGVLFERGRLADPSRMLLDSAIIGDRAGRAARDGAAESPRAQRSEVRKVSPQRCGVKKKSYQQGTENVGPTGDREYGRGPRSEVGARAP